MDLEDNKIGLIAGEGEFPIILARTLKDKNYQIVAICFSNEQKEKLKKFTPEVFKISIGQFGKLIKIFKENSIKNLVFLGKIDKSHALKVGIPDFKALALWRKIKIKEDDSILRSVIEELEKEGFSIRGPSEFLQEFLTPEGIFTKRVPTPEEWEDIKYGFKIAKMIGSLDIGQCVVVKNKMTVAVEAMEGTDETILRAGKLRKNTVVIKIAKPIQDLRMDLPVAGLKTVETLIKAQAKVLALEVGKTFFLQREEAIKLADKNNISIVGYKEE
ncbi:MAG: DUF1009 domain-containing protein [Thermodesulfobacterium geofontis]|uniref:DUF1009 domain-containing protein n=1 Tax=Thermodesulfobacterium geofontis TaxID=1295609 RepID=A0A2N7PQV0_9BACT|nr:MAG: DUF1009 domain-containing protein [Thermodesulfobacterium geofontis]PMP97750.1 MAG: DUF1009 domain-containing protein [Thermodesulfobacterium geofontis]